MLAACSGRPFTSAEARYLISIISTGAEEIAAYFVAALDSAYYAP